MRLLTVIYVFGLMFAASAGASQSESAIEQARSMKLAEQPGWLALLHYKRETFSRRFVSQADDTAFFLSANGKTEPGEELEADLAAFYKPSAPGHAQCLYPARWHWLKQQLGISTGHDVPCPKLESWLQRVSTDSLTLVFPVMYMNNPASSFGHTFLRFDADPVLLSYALNYAADIDREDNFMLYAYNGLFGGYSGVFNTRLYYETVQQYSDIENRDIWEYRLDYTPAEIEQLARHVWEVTGINFDYYFFRENCSYRLLALLDAVRPQVGLTTGEAFSLYAIPVDTVRALEQKQQILHRQYRASLASQLRTGFERSSAEEKAWILQLADSSQSVEALVQQQPQQQAVLLDLAYTLMQFRGQGGSLRGNEILAARSRQASQDHARVNVEQPLPPESGHASARIAIGSGRQNRQSFVDLLIRPAFHDLVDSPAGYVAGSEIRVLEARLRWLPDDERVQLESLDFINLVSLSPVNEWYAPLSWQLGAKLEQRRFGSAESDMTFVTRGGGGYSTRMGESTLYAMLLLEADISEQYQHDYSLLGGLQLGVSMVFTAAQALLWFETDESFSGFDQEKDTVSFEWQFNLGTDTSLRAGYKKIRYPQFDDEEWLLSLQQYF